MRLLLGLGGNLGDVAAAFAGAAAALSAHGRVVAASRVWRSAAVGPPQPDFLNAALLYETGDDAWRVLARAQRLECAAGRERERAVRWGPRQLDVDLLLAPGVVVESPALVLPHPRLAARRFALLPAAEVAPDWVHPRLRATLAELAARLDAADQPCAAIGDFPAFG